MTKHFSLRAFLAMLIMMVAIGSASADEVTFDFTNVTNAKSYGIDTDNMAAVGTSTGSSVSIKNVTLQSDKVSATFTGSMTSTAPVYYCAGTSYYVRVYSGNNIIISIADGYKITKITATGSNVNKGTSYSYWKDDFDLNGGYNDAAGKSSVTFNCVRSTPYIYSITITYAKEYKVNWHVNGSTTTNTLLAGSAIEAPSVTAPTGYEFMGWSTSSIDDKVQTAPTFVTVPETVSADADYYAVFAKVPGTTTSSISQADFKVGQYYLIDKIGDNYYAAYGSGTSLKCVDVTSAVTVNGQVITLDVANAAVSSQMLYTIAESGTKYSLQNGSTYLKQSTSNGSITSTKGNDWTLVWNAEGNGVSFTSSYSNMTAGTTTNTYFGLRVYTMMGSTSYLCGSYAESNRGNSGYGTGYFYLLPIPTYTDYCTTVPDVLKVSSVGWATFYTDHAFYMPEGMTGYFVTSSDGNATLSPTYYAGNAVPECTPLLLKAEPGTYELQRAGNPSSEYYGNLLRGQLEAGMIEAESGDNYYYKLTTGKAGTANEGKVGFYWGAADGAVFKLNNNNRAYLVLPKSLFDNGSNKIQGFAFEEDGTITAIESVETTTDAAIYDLSGRRVVAPVRGQLYISNGQKFIQK